jgi:hypothetical protein
LALFETGAGCGKSQILQESQGLERFGGATIQGIHIQGFHIVKEAGDMTKVQLEEFFSRSFLTYFVCR